MSLDPLNIGRLKTCGENLVIAFPWVFFLSTMNVASFSVCKLALDASFQQIDRKHNCLYFTFSLFLEIDRKYTAEYNPYISHF